MTEEVLIEEPKENPFIAETCAGGESKKATVISWYRTPIEPKLMKELHKKSDLKGFAQTLPILALLVGTGAAAVYGAGRFPWWVVALLVFTYGTFMAFFINAVHELGHGTVFKTKWLNSFFVRIFAFVGWFNFERFNVSHARHHRYTLHQPDDLEVVLPMKILMKNFFMRRFICIWEFPALLQDTIRVARGEFKSEWEQALFPDSNKERWRPVQWARILLVGHGLVLVAAIYFKLWLLPVVVTLTPFYGKWLFVLCNETQHTGLQDKVPDFRLCCRTFTLNPFLQFLYWNMNYHIEHHMYAAVPCYNLPKLHAAIKHDLPHCHHGLYPVWKEIAEIQAKQRVDPSYQYVAKLPEEEIH